LTIQEGLLVTVLSVWYDVLSLSTWNKYIILHIKINEVSVAQLVRRLPPMPESPVQISLMSLAPACHYGPSMVGWILLLSLLTQGCLCMVNILSIYCQINVLSLTPEMYCHFG